MVMVGSGQSQVAPPKKLNIVIDGTWFEYQCYKGQLAKQMAEPGKPFPFSIKKLVNTMLKIIRLTEPMCVLGVVEYSTSILDIPSENTEMVIPEGLRKSIEFKEFKIQEIKNRGYSMSGIFRRDITSSILDRYVNGELVEKMVDCFVASILVYNAIMFPDDIHLLIAGDGDMFPAIEIAKQNDCQNIWLGTTSDCNDEVLIIIGKNRIIKLDEYADEIMYVKKVHV